MSLISEQLFKLFVNDELMGQVEKATVDVADAKMLPAVCYTSQEWFEFEKKALFERQWVCVGRSDLLRKPGDYYTITINDDPLLVVKGHDEQIRVMSGVCQHRGHLLIEGTGSCATGLFRCPLHYWTYTLNGELKNTPEMDRTHFNKADHCLPQLKVEVWQGFVFAHYRPDAPPLAPTLTQLADEMANYDVAGMASIPTMDIPGYPWNWKEMLENAMEPYHNAYLHKGIHDFALGHGFCEHTPDENVIMHPTGFDRLDAAFNPIHRALLPVIPALSEEQRGRVMFVMVPPMLFLGLVPDHMFYFLVLPNGPHEITLRVGLSFPPASMKVKNFDYILKWIIDGIMMYNDQDVQANTAVHKGLKSGLKTRGPYSWKETTLVQFNRWLYKRYREYAESLGLVTPKKVAVAV